MFHDEEKANANTYLEEMAQRLKSHGHRAEIRVVVSEQTAVALLETAKQVKADAIALEYSRPQRSVASIPGKRCRQGPPRHFPADSHSSAGRRLGPAKHQHNAMTTEIDILVHAADKGCAIVEKESHQLWDSAELTEAAKLGGFAQEDSLEAPTEQVEISAPYPGCMQQSARPAQTEDYRLVGQTRHFLIFTPNRISR